VLGIINESARVYNGVIPDDCYHEPYMSLDELRREMSEMTFFGIQEADRMLAVGGYQPVKDVTLVRHIYVLPERQGRGIGGELLNHIMSLASTREVLVGTWSAASWAIRFYQRHGFKLAQNKDDLLKKYWNISERQIQLSVVLRIEHNGY
jgi:GNAT superfamily N-acetyltransferase